MIRVAAPSAPLVSDAVYHGVRYSNQGVANIARDVVSGWVIVLASVDGTARLNPSSAHCGSAFRVIVIGRPSVRKNGATSSSSTTCKARIQNSVCA